jgi:predicted amidohydrolase YtcJ
MARFPIWCSSSTPSWTTSLRTVGTCIYDLDIGIWSKAAQIDAALSNGKFARRRVVLFGSDGHTAWANRAARAKGGITRSFIQKLPEQLRRYYGADANMHPNGFVVDAGQDTLDKSLPPSSLDP